MDGSEAIERIDLVRAGFKRIDKVLDNLRRLSADERAREKRPFFIAASGWMGDKGRKLLNDGERRKITNIVKKCQTVGGNMVDHLLR
jgi:hypothetical protein